MSERFVLAVASGCVLALGGVATAQQVPTTIEDFFIPGTQPNEFTDTLRGPNDCTGCHSDFDPVTAPWERWRHSMMGQAGRDPMFYAALAVANDDVNDVGDLCLRCHTPMGWLNGRSTPTDGSMLTQLDETGVSCSICHRMVDPVYQAGVSPAVDEQILMNMAHPLGAGEGPHSASMHIDPLDRRRGPFDLGMNFFSHDWQQSPHHRSSTLCANCHDVSNPVYELDTDGTYVLTDVGDMMPAPSDNKYTQFPVERTYSEWLMSDFALGPVDVGGRFGGTMPAVSTCQDCHMPQDTGQVCAFGLGRPDIKLHEFLGANTWVLRAVADQYPQNEHQMTTQGIEDAIARNTAFLQSAGDLELTLEGSMLKVRVINQTGHKLPTGYAEGRRIWVNVQFMDDTRAIVQEYGAYDQSTGILDTVSTKVYEGKMGITQEVADATGKPVGESFHFALNNDWVFDNRIPPRGFTNANFESVQAAPVGYTYADGQHWDDTLFPIPQGATSVRVRVYHQTTTREYIEFLQKNGGTPGQTAYMMWADPVIGNKSEPVVMMDEMLPIGTPCFYDVNNTGSVDIVDFTLFSMAFGSETGDANYDPALDFNGTGAIDIVDFTQFASEFGRDDC